MGDSAEKIENESVTLIAATPVTENQGAPDPEPAPNSNLAAEPGTMPEPVAPFSGAGSIEDSDNHRTSQQQLRRGKQAGINRPENQIQKSATTSGALPPLPVVAAIIAHSRLLSLVFGVIIALAAGFYIWHEQAVADNQFHSFTDKAQLAAYGGDQRQASLMWKNAIDASSRLPLSKRLVAGLHIKYANSLHYLAPPSASRQAEMEQGLPIWAQERQALHAALSIYEHCPNSQSEQMMTLRTLDSVYGREVAEQPGRYDIFDNRGLVFLADGSSKAAAAIKPGISDDNVASMMRFLTKYRDPTSIVNQLDASLRQCKTAADFEKFIPVYEQVVYFNARLCWARDIENAEKNLDWIVYKARKDYTIKYRVKLADEAFARHDWHGAIVEYGRYLAGSKDLAAQSRLIDARRKNRVEELGSRSDCLPGYIACLQKLKNLEEKQFGANDKATVATTMELIDAYLVNEDLSLAQMEITQLWLRNHKQFVPLVYAITGKNPAPPASVAQPKNDTQLRLLWLQCRADLHKGCYYDGMRDLEWIAHIGGVTPILRDFFASMASECGRYDMADDQFKKDQPNGDLFGSTSGMETFDPLMF